MPKRTALLAWIVTACLTSGCGQQAKPVASPPAPTPLTVEQWRRLPVNQKYDEATFDRLKLQDPDLRNERVWQRFMVETVIPERRQDLPDDFPG